MSNKRENDQELRGPGKRKALPTTGIGIGETTTPGVGILILQTSEGEFCFALTAEMFREWGAKMILTADMLPDPDQATPVVEPVGPKNRSAN